MLGSCEIDENMFNDRMGGRLGNVLSNGEVYVVLEQIGRENEEKLSFGLKVIGENGKRIGKGTKALLVTKKRCWVSKHTSLMAEFWDDIFDEKRCQEGILRKLQVHPIIDTKASNIETWLNEIKANTEKNILDDVIWKSSKPTKFQDLKLNVNTKQLSEENRRGDEWRNLKNERNKKYRV